MSVSSTYGENFRFQQCATNTNPSLVHSHPPIDLVKAQAEIMLEEELRAMITRLGIDMSNINKTICDSRELNLQDRDLQLLAQGFEKDINLRVYLLEVYDRRFPHSPSPVPSEEGYPIFSLKN